MQTYVQLKTEEVKTMATTQENNTEKYFDYNYKSIDLPDGVCAQVDFIKYKKVMIIKDFENTVNGKTIALSHVYNNEGGTGVPYGYGFNLNLCERYNDEAGVLVEANGDTFYRTGDTIKNYRVYGRVTPPLIEYVPEANNLNRYNNICWLYADGVFKGYHVSNVKLAIICDTTGNCILINYNTDGSLKNVKYSKGGTSKYIYELTYENGKLKKVIDNITNKSIEYTYSGNVLSTISKSGLTYNLKISEDEDSDELEEIKTSNGYIIYNFPLSVVLKSEVNSGLEGEVIARWEFKNVGDNTVQITDIDGNREQIKYAKAGYISEQIIEQNGVVVSAEQCVYVKHDYRYTYKARRSSLFEKKIEDFAFELGEHTKTKLNSYDQPTKSTTYEIPVSDSASAKSETTYTYNSSNQLEREETVVTYSKSGLSNVSYTYITEYSYSADGKTVTKTSWVDGEENLNGKNIEKQVITDSTDGTRTIKTEAYNSKADADKIYTEKKYNSNGQQISEYNGIDGKVSCTYNASGEMQAANYYNKNGIVNRTVSYTYDSQSRVTNVSSAGSNNFITYTSGEVTKLYDGTEAINLSYDEKRRITEASIGKQTIGSYWYTESTVSGKEAKTVLLSYANFGSFKSVAANDGSFLRGYINGKLHNITNYNKDGSIATDEDRITKEKTTYTYDSLGRVTKAETEKGGVVTQVSTYRYDRFGNLDRITRADSPDSDELSLDRVFAYENNSTKRLYNEFIHGKYDTFYKYDKLGRINEKKILSLANDDEEENTIVDKQTITYQKNGSYTTNRPVEIIYKNWKDIEEEDIEYEYDEAGRITRIDTNSDIFKYEYDSRGRLTCEENTRTRRKKIYQYDNYGNLKSIYEYDLYEDEDGEEIFYGSTQFNYDSKNRLTGSGYEYDVIGNPTTYKGRSVTWKGKMLINYAGTAFTYDGKGRRKSKGDITFTYDCEGNLIKQSNGLEFFYDSQGVAGFVYNGKTYFYRKDAQGNVIAIKDSVGDSIVKYYYDAWGDYVIDGNSTIGVLNPFRYRSYYYDTETGLYYLQTRYYDPYNCRFLNMDSINYADPSSIGGLNLYAYCNNDPVNNVDPTGHDALEVLKYIGIIAFVATSVIAVAIAASAVAATCGLAGAAMMSVAMGMGFGAISGAISAGINGTDIAAGILCGAIKGGAVGFSIGLGIVTAGAGLSVGGAVLSFVTAGVVNFVAGMADYAIDNGMNNRSLTWEGAFGSGAMQLLSGSLAFFAGFTMGKLGVYNIPKVDKLFSATWFDNFISQQYIKALTYYPFDWLIRLFGGNFGG